jgi:endonuclease V-like protein UPF0215 family
LRDDVKFRRIKREIRILAVDDCPFIPRQPGRVNIIGVVFRGGNWLDGAMHTRIDIDGFDVTIRIVGMVCSSPHFKQLRIIMLDGITFAGFNIVDIHALFELTGLPVLALTREKVNIGDVKKALMNLDEWEKRLDLIDRAGCPQKIQVRGTELHVQMAGISREDVEKIVRISSTRGNIPEPLRVAHIIASAFIERLDQ